MASSSSKSRRGARSRLRGAGSSILSSSVRSYETKPTKAGVFRHLDVGRVSSFENSFVTAEGGIRRANDIREQTTARSAPARANRSSNPTFSPPRDNTNIRNFRIRTSLGLRLKHASKAIMIAQKVFGSPEQQKAGSGTAYAEQHKGLTPIKKIKTGLERLKGTGRTGVVLVSWGAFNPIHLNHVRMFQCARKMLEAKTSFGVVGGFICPAHDKFVRSKCRSNVNEAIPPRHRARMCEAMVRSSSWIDVDRWEVTRDTGFLDYPCVLEHVRDYLAGTLPDQHIHVMYVSGIDDLVKTAEDTLTTFGCVCVSRFDQKTSLKTAKRIAKRYPNRVFIAEDDEIVHHQLANLNATQIRRRIIQGKDVSILVGPDVAAYMRKHNILDKLKKKSWLPSDRKVKPLLKSMTQAKAAREQAKAAKKRAERNRVDTANTSIAVSETDKDPDEDSDDCLKTLRERLKLNTKFIGSHKPSFETDISLYGSNSVEF